MQQRKIRRLGTIAAALPSALFNECCWIWRAVAFLMREPIRRVDEVLAFLGFVSDVVRAYSMFNCACGNCLWRHRAIGCSHSTLFGSVPTGGVGPSPRSIVPPTPGGRTGTRARFYSGDDPIPEPPGLLPLRRSRSRRDAGGSDPSPDLQHGGGNFSPLASPRGGRVSLF